MNTTDVFDALAEPTRREILGMLARQGELSAGDIKKGFSISAPALSQHFNVLKEAGLVTVRKKAQSRIYTINVSGISLAENWLTDIKHIFENQLDRLESFLQNQSKKGVGHDKRRRKYKHKRK